MEGDFQNKTCKVNIIPTVGDGAAMLALRMALWEAQRGLMTCSCKIFVMTIQSDYESTSPFSPFQYPLLSLTKEDKGVMKASCSCRIYEKADF